MFLSIIKEKYKKNKNLKAPLNDNWLIFQYASKIKTLPHKFIYHKNKNQYFLLYILYSILWNDNIYYIQVMTLRTQQNNKINRIKMVKCPWKNWFDLICFGYNSSSFIDTFLFFKFITFLFYFFVFCWECLACCNIIYCLINIFCRAAIK